MEAFSPVIVIDHMSSGKGEWKKDKKVPLAWVVIARQGEAFCHDLKITIWMQKQYELLAETGPWKCQVGCCGEEAKFFVSLHILRIDDLPYKLTPSAFHRVVFPSVPSKPSKIKS
jgi:hypothetical protein